MYTINNSNVSSQRKKIFIKRKDLNFVGFPKINFPFLQSQKSNVNITKGTKIIQKYNQNLANFKNKSSSNLKFSGKNTRFKSSENQLYNLMKENRNSAEKRVQNNDNDLLEILNNISNYNSLSIIWNDFYITESYKKYFNLVLNKLPEEEREELCLKELKELSELKNNIISLIKEIKLRKKTLSKLFQLNNLLNRDIVTEVNAPDNTTLKEISEQIVNLRMHSINICFKMKKIKNKIYEGYIYGKFDLDIISNKFGFDKDYLIKMKEEMKFLKKGKIGAFFNIGKSPDPFLIKTSENVFNNKNDASFYVIPMSKEVDESIKQCNYFIYQELIYFQSNKNRLNNLLSNQEENINFHENYNESISERDLNDKNYLGNILLNSKNIKNQENIKDFNNRRLSSDRSTKINKKEKDESILFEENRINMNDILEEKIVNKKDLQRQKSISKNSDKKQDRLSDSQISKVSYYTSNATKRGKVSNKNMPVIIYEGYIHYFEDNFYKEYFKLIPQQEIKMFNLQSHLSSKMFNGIAPFLLLVKDENYNNNQLKDNENIFGICAFNHLKINNKLKIRIIHISALVDFNYNDYVDNLRNIYHSLLNFIINEFSFDEISIEFSQKDFNEEIYNIFKELDFVKKSISLSKNQIKSNGGEDSSNNGQINLNYLIYKNKNELNDSARKSLSSFYGNNIFHIFNSILLCNSSKESNINNYNGIEMIPEEIEDIKDLKYKDSEIFINLSAIEKLFQFNKKNNITKLYNRITSLDELMKIFLSYKIDKNEIPLSAAEYRFNVVGFVINKFINNILMNSSKLINNYNFFTSDSFLEQNSGIYYNFIKSNNIYELYDDNGQFSFYIFINDNYAMFFIKFENQEIEKEIFNGQNLYTQVNDIFKSLISNRKINLLKNKILWIPCFHSFRHLKCLINNTYFTVHEYIQISNKIINRYERRKKEKYYETLFQSTLNSFLIEPQINNDIIIDNNFFIGIINNANYFNRIIINKSNITNDNKEKIISTFSSDNKIAFINNKESEQDSILQNNPNDKDINTINSVEYPNIIFLSYIQNNDFIKI